MDELTRQRYKAAIENYDKTMAAKNNLAELSMSELQTLQKSLEKQLKSNPAKEMAIADAMKAKPMEPPARMMERLREAVAQIPRTENAPGVGKSGTMREMLAKMTPEARADVLARPDAMRNIEGSIAKIAPMETPYGKSLLSYTPEGKIAGKTGAALRGLGKLASRVASPIGAALTAIDLGQALSEVQDKGAAKIAEDYRKEQERKALAESEDMGDRVIEKMNPIQSNSKQYSLEENVPSSAKSQLGSGARRDYQSSKYSGNPSMKNESPEYSPEERAKLKDMLSKYRATPTLR